MSPVLDLRAHLDTRAGRLVLLGSVALIVLAVTAAGIEPPLLRPAGTADASLALVAVRRPLSLILPVLAVTIVAGDWSDGSIQQTLLARPGRLRVLGSKLLAGLGLGAAVSVLAMLLVLLAMWIGGSLLGDGTGVELLGASLGELGMLALAQILFALAVGAALQSVVLALVVALGLPVAVSIAGSLAARTGSDVLPALVRALDLEGAALRLATGEAGPAEAGTIALLVLLPLAVGAKRWLIREIP